MAANLLEAEERETMGEAEAELEAARRYVRWAGGTVARDACAVGVPPRTVARAAASPRPAATPPPCSGRPYRPV